MLKKEHKDIVQEIRATVHPTPAEQKEVKNIQEVVLKKIKCADAKAVLGGSGAKNTWLKEAHDIDIYVKFPFTKYKDKSDKIANILHKSLKKSFTRVTRLHGSRDYFQIKHKSYTIEIIPILAITNMKQAKNITDFSQFHVRYVVSNIKKKKGLADEIRLAKVFAKANGFYGAESYVKGLSGYALEVLLIKYGSFLRFVQAAAQWKQTEHIGQKKLLDRLNWAKKQSPLRIIDPVQPDRNVAAALSREQYERIKKVCKQFLKRPTYDFFVKQTVDLMRLAKKGNLLIIKAVPQATKRDVAGAKALKAFEFIVKQLKEFQIKEKIFEFEDKQVTIYIVTEEERLPAKKRCDGPPIENKKAMLAFKKAHKSTKVQTDKKTKKAYTMQQRKITQLHAYVKKVLEEDQVGTRINNIVLIQG